MTDKTVKWSMSTTASPKIRIFLIICSCNSKYFSYPCATTFKWPFQLFSHDLYATAMIHCFDHLLTTQKMRIRLLWQSIWQMMIWRLIWQLMIWRLIWQRDHVRCFTSSLNPYSVPCFCISQTLTSLQSLIDHTKIHRRMLWQSIW